MRLRTRYIVRTPRGDYRALIGESVDSSELAPEPGDAFGDVDLASSGHRQTQRAMTAGRARVEGLDTFHSARINSGARLRRAHALVAR